MRQLPELRTLTPVADISVPDFVPQYRSPHPPQGASLLFPGVTNTTAGAHTGPQPTAPRKIYREQKPPTLRKSTWASKRWSEPPSPDWAVPRPCRGKRGTLQSY